jgi:hypothetical protein
MLAAGQSWGNSERYRTQPRNDCEDRQASQTSRLRFPMWFLLQALIFFAVMASNIAWHWAPNPYVAALIGVGLAIGATQIVTGIQYLAAVLRRNRRP